VSYTKSKNTYFTVPKADARDSIAVEVGDSKDANFLPQAKVMRWDNEVNLSVRLVHDEANPAVARKGDKVQWKGKKKAADFYEIAPNEQFPEGASEVEITLFERPENDRVQFTLNTKGVRFAYQPELTAEEVEAGFFRPENVVGSYAVFTDEDKVNIAGGKLYRSGKVGHIYRPRIEDSAGKWTWGDLNIENGILTVTIPQEFLDNATYPILHAAGLTFGYTSIGGTLIAIAAYWTGANGRQYGHKATPSNGEIDSVTYYGNSNSGSLNTKAMVWLGSDGTVVANGVSPVVAVNTTPSWWTANYSSKPTITAQAYFLGAVAQGTSDSFSARSDTETNGGNFHQAAIDFYTTPTTLGSNLGTNVKFSVYATYTGVDGGGAPRIIGSRQAVTRASFR
jgi:hypothetical protein